VQSFLLSVNIHVPLRHCVQFTAGEKRAEGGEGRPRPAWIGKRCLLRDFVDQYWRATPPAPLCLHPDVHLRGRPAIGTPSLLIPPTGQERPPFPRQRASHDSRLIITGRPSWVLCGSSLGGGEGAGWIGAHRLFMRRWAGSTGAGDQGLKQRVMGEDGQRSTGWSYLRVTM